MPLLRDLQEAVNAYCQREGVSYTAIAERAGMKREALSRAMAAGHEGAGRKGVSLDTLERLAKAIGMKWTLEPKGEKP